MGQRAWVSGPEVVRSKRNQIKKGQFGVIEVKAIGL